MNHSVFVALGGAASRRWLRTRGTVISIPVVIEANVQLLEIVLSCGFSSITGNPRNHVVAKGKHARPGSLSVRHNMAGGRSLPLCSQHCKGVHRVVKGPATPVPLGLHLAAPPRPARGRGSGADARQAW